MKKSENESENFAMLEKKLVKAMNLVYVNLIKFKKEKNSPLVVMREGKIVHIKAEDLEMPLIKND
ncbi:hypothetical protein [Frigoriflavimonas asaccharolytica]|uniref:Uncharacterized protein n=1 Tax=Frigoriflavimonas asaccharolytica TaxID=2735899 RepID=A0A8J8G7N6_9FLAO|nr:hypothetical protein [Frigoriflavimonas asaccharolytica]NRS92481.1 hypothetical protein [Frigoriflavimonas asaccharolytica]